VSGREWVMGKISELAELSEDFVPDFDAVLFEMQTDSEPDSEMYERIQFLRDGLKKVK
jgi:hypothetical protein